jgi:quercetin dioxygenase-like cupin family protein
MSEYHYLADLAALMGDAPQDSIVSRTFLDTDRLRAILFGFAPGQELSEHTASMPAVLYFISGEARLTLGGDEQQAAAGTWAHMPANLSHSIRAETPVTMLLLMLKDRP